jgi:hypothetical protein
MTQPIVYPTYFTTGPMIDLVAIIGTLASNIATVRVNRGLPALVCPPGYPTAPIMIGKEWLDREHSPPRIVLVPTTIRTEAAIRMGQQPMTGAVSQAQLRPFGAGTSASRRTSGATRIRRVPILSTTSTRPSSSIASCSARLPATSATSRTSRSASKRGAGISRPTIADSGANSLSPGASPSTSLTSHGSSCRTPPRPRRAFRSTRPSRWLSPTAQRRLPASSFSRPERSSL